MVSTRPVNIVDEDERERERAERGRSVGPRPRRRRNSAYLGVFSLPPRLSTWSIFTQIFYIEPPRFCNVLSPVDIPCLNCMNMNVALRLQAIARRPGAAWSSNILRRSAQWRCFSSAPPSPDNLPLAGIRVLDMTRVLAGVRLIVKLFCTLER